MEAALGIGLERPIPSCTITRLFFWSSLAKLARTSFKALVSPRHSEWHWPPPNGGPSHQAIRDEVLKIAAAPFGQPGSLIGALPSPPVINAKACGETIAAIAIASKTTVACCHCLRRRPSIDGGIGMISSGFLVLSNLLEKRAMTWFLRLSASKTEYFGRRMIKKRCMPKMDQPHFSAADWEVSIARLLVYLHSVGIRTNSRST
jgi:hypothetical protein